MNKNFEIYCRKFSQVIQAESMLKAMYLFAVENPSEDIICVEDIEARNEAYASQQPMRWIKASERLPEFKSKKQMFVCRYILSKHPYELWNWDTINNRQAASYDFEWLSESNPDESPKKEDEGYWKQRCEAAERVISYDDYTKHTEYIEQWLSLKQSPLDEKKEDEL